MKIKKKRSHTNIKVHFIKPNKILLYSLSAMLTTSILFYPIDTFALTTEQFTVTYSESSPQEQSKVITLPSNYDSISSVSVETGDVDFSISGNQMTINVSNGKASSKDSYYNPTLSSREENSVDYSDTNSFPASVPYSDEGGYSGSLSATSPAYVVSGAYTPGSSKTITETQTVANPAYLAETLEYSKNGYSGILTKSGNYIKNINDEYIQYYTGTVYSKDTDTRKWRQDYSGEVYKGGTDYKNYKYSYKVTITYKAGSLSTANCSYKGVSPSSNSTTNFHPKCVTLDSGTKDLYTMKYNFSVTGISDASQKGK